MTPARFIGTKGWRIPNDRVAGSKVCRLEVMLLGLLSVSLMLKDDCQIVMSFSEIEVFGKRSLKRLSCHAKLALLKEAKTVLIV